MPRTYATCRPGSNRYAVTTEAMGRALNMCRQLAPDDTEPRTGRRTRCFDPSKDGSKRKTCQILVPHTFGTIVPPSYYIPSQLQRAGIEYTCDNPDPIMGGTFEGQGADYNVHLGAAHLIVGPVFERGEWVVLCRSPATLLPYGLPAYVAVPRVFDRFDTVNIMSKLKYIPTSDDCTAIADRLAQETRFICRDGHRDLDAIAASVRGLVEHELCADQTFEPVRKIIAATNTEGKRGSLRELCFHLWNMGMYSRRWAGKGTPFPFSVVATKIRVTDASRSADLAGRRDPLLSVPLDYISALEEGDEAEGVLVNAVRYHTRCAFELLHNCEWLEDDEAQESLQNLRCATSDRLALVPRASAPTRFVHSLLPSSQDTIYEIVERVGNNAFCIRMASSLVIMSAIMLCAALGPLSVAGAPWVQQTSAQGDPMPLLETLRSIT